MKTKTINTILNNTPNEELTPEFLEDIGLDTKYRGVYYLDRCFIDDIQGEREKYFSNFFVNNLVGEDLMPSKMMDFIDNEEAVKAMSSLWQWLSTNVGRGYLYECWQGVGYTLSIKREGNPDEEL